MNARSHQSGSDPIGSAAEEALRLVGALAGWASEHAGNANEHLATGAAECTYCPVCRTVHAVREVSPDVRDHLMAAGASLMHAFAGLATAASAAAGARSSTSPRAPGVDRIHVDTPSDADTEHESEVEWPEV